MSEIILDIHTHKPAPQPQGIVSLLNLEEPLIEGQLYSVGIHPWDTSGSVSEDYFEKLEKIATDRRVAAIGECGIDLSKGGPLFRQLQILKRQIELSERLEKPLILHCVKGADILLGLKRDFNPRQPWIIHGFRGRPELGRQLTDKGFYLSFGEKFNPDSLVQTPPERVLAETDESILTIGQIIENLSETVNYDLTPQILSNTEKLKLFGKVDH